jgi:hypothetical protein
MELARQHAVRALVDLRRAVLLIAPGDWDAIATQTVQEGPPDVALGLLVDPSGEAMAWRYCMGMMQRGHTRVPFTSAEQALRWAGVPHSTLQPARPSVQQSADVP